MSGFDVVYLRQQQDAVLRQIQKATDKAVEAIGHRAEYAAKISTPSKTYQMRGGWKHRSWRTGGIANGELYNMVPHAIYQEEGTGIWGPRRAKYPIVPRRKRCLSWTSGGQRFFARRVMHPGVKPRFIGYAAIYGRAAPFVGEDHSRNIATIERELSVATR
jgi:hypothetical protein